MPQEPNSYITQRSFSGLDVLHPPQDMGLSNLLQADNVYIYGGEAVQRPGKQGLWTAPLAGTPDVFLLVEYDYLTTAGSVVTALLLTAAGKLYQHLVGNLAPIEILIGAYSYTDIVIDGTSLNKATSVLRPFTSADVDRTVVISGGTHFTPGSYTITGVTTGKATFSANIGTVLSSTGGTGAFGPSFNLNSSVAMARRIGKFAIITDESISLTDLVINGSNTAIVTSAGHPFQPADAGKQLTINLPGATGTWTPGVYTIASVDGSNNATLSMVNAAGAIVVAVVGTVGATGGIAVLAGPPYQVDITAVGIASAAVMTALIPPPTAISPIALTNKTLDAFNTTTGWTGDYLQPPAATKAITGATNANPIVITSATHGYSNGDLVSVAGLPSTAALGRNSAANGFWVVTNKATDTFELWFLDGTKSTGNTNYTSGGTVQKCYDAATLYGYAGGVNMLPEQGTFVSSGATGAGWTGVEVGGGALSLTGVNETDPWDTTKTVTFMQMDDQGSTFQTSSALPNLQIVNDKTRYAKDFYISLYMISSYVTDSVDVTVIGYSDLAGTLALAVRTINLKASSTGAAVLLAGVVPFGDVDTPILSWTVTYHAGPKNKAGNNGPYIGRLCAYPIVGNGTLTGAAATYTVSNSAIGFDPNYPSSLTLPGTTDYIAGFHAIKNFIGANPAKTITGATNATPIVVTSASHGFTNGQTVIVQDVLGNISANNSWVVASVTTNTFALTTFSGGNSVGTGTYLSGGTATLAPGIDFSQTQTVAIGVKPIAIYTAATALSFRLGLRNSAGITYSNVATLSADATYYAVDISTMTTAEQQGITALEIVFLLDFPQAVKGALFALGPLTSAGNKTANFPYQFVYTEVNDTTVDINGVATGNVTDGQIESDPCPISVTLTPDELNATVSGTFPAFTNATSNYFYLYEYGGTQSANDTLFTGRLVAMLPRWSDTVNVLSPGATYVTWNHTALTFVDNTPDGQEFGVTTLVIGRGAPPFGCTAVAEYQGRIVLTVGSTIYVSWLIEAGQAAALYFNSVIQTDDPYAVIKGGVFSIGGADNDNITCMKWQGAVCAIAKGKSVYQLIGVDGLNFQIYGHLIGSGVGCVAPRAFVGVEGDIWTVCASGVYKYDGGETTTVVSKLVESLLNPVMNGGTVTPAAAYAKCVAVYHGQRFYLFAPAPGGSSNSVCYVWDQFNQGWTRYLQMNITSALSLSSAANTNDLYLGGIGDGMIYQLTGAGDKASAGASATAVTWTVGSRGMGQEIAFMHNMSGREYWQQNRPVRAWCKLSTGESTAITLVTGAEGTTLTSTSVKTLNGYAQQIANVFVHRDVRGDPVTLVVSGSTITTSKITAFGIEIARGKVT